MPSGTDLGKLIIRQALPRGASAKPQMRVLDGDLTTIEVLFVPKSGLNVTGFVLVGAGLEAPTLEGTPVLDTTSGGVRANLSVKTGQPRVGFKYKLYAKTASGTETKQPSATVVYDSIFGWSPVKKSSSVQNLEVKGDTVFGMDNTNSKAMFKGSGGVTVDSKLTIAGSGTNRGAVSLVQTDKSTPGSSVVLELSGTPVGSATVSPPGGAKYTFFKCCGPSGNSLKQDYLQLIRSGPNTAVQPSGSGVLEIAAKMLPVNPLLPAENIMNVFADLYVGGALTSSLGSFGATNPPVSLTPSGQWVLGVFGGWRVAFGWQFLGSSGSSITFTTAFTGLPIVLVSNSTTGFAGDVQMVRASDIAAASFMIRAFALNGSGGGNLNVAWLAIGPA